MPPPSGLHARGRPAEERLTGQMASEPCFPASLLVFWDMRAMRLGRGMAA